MKKYEFTGETKVIELLDRKATLHRIRAVRDFGNVKAGELGGWIESEKNLSHEENAWVDGNARVGGNAVVRGDAWVDGNARVGGNARVCGNAVVFGNARVCGNAKVFSANHVLVIGAIGSRNDFTTFYRNKDKQIMVKCGCFCDSIDKFLEKVAQTHGESKCAEVYEKAAELAKLQIDLSDEAPESEG